MASRVARRRPAHRAPPRDRERHRGAGRREQPGADRRDRRGDDVLLHRRLGIGREAEALGRLGQQEERPEAAGEVVLGLVPGAVEVRALLAAIGAASATRRSASATSSS